MRKVFCIIGPGQSNEAGNGVTPTATRNFGVPIADPVGANGSSVKRGMWCDLSELLGKRNMWFVPYNISVGSTSVVHSWCGVVRAWTYDAPIMLGTYILANGNIYKCNSTGQNNMGRMVVTGSISGSVLTVTVAGFSSITNGAVVTVAGLAGGTTITSFGTGTGGTGTYNLSNSATVASTSIQINVSTTIAPSGAANTTTLDGISYIYKAAARGQDVAGYIYPYTDAYFDPNGYFAAANTALNNAKARGGYSDYWAFISIGQQDMAMASTKTEFSTGLQNATNYWLNKGVKVAIGFTCYGATSGMDAWQTSIPGATPTTDPSTDTGNGIGGMYLAQQAFVGNSNVVAGANLRYALGVMTVNPATGLPGLQSDSLHMNDQQIPLAAAAWRDQLVKVGWA